MTGYSDAAVWAIIAGMALGTFAIRFSFLGLFGRRQVPAGLLRYLRYTPVAVIPALMAPAILWPAATGGQTDPVRLAAAGATLAVGRLTGNVLGAILAGGAVLAAGWALGL